MSEYKFNNGNPTNIGIDPVYLPSMHYVSVVITVDDAATKVAGHSIINLAGDISFEDVQFKNHSLDYGMSLSGKKLTVIVDVSKFKTNTQQINGSVSTITCDVIIEAGDNLINKYSLNDKDQTEQNSVFNYLFTFTNI